MTLVAMKAAWRRPATASATISSARPSAYISAVSMWVRPRSSPRDSAAISSFLSLRSSPMCQVPWPTTGRLTPVGPKGRESMRRVYTGPKDRRKRRRRLRRLTRACSPPEPEHGGGEATQNERRRERREVRHPLEGSGGESDEGETDDGNDGRAAAHDRASTRGKPEDATERPQHAAGPAGAPAPPREGGVLATLEHEHEVGRDQERHEEEPREVRHGYSKAPLRAVLVRGRE